MSQGQVNDIMTDATLTGQRHHDWCTVFGFKNDRRVIPLCYDFPCKFIKIKWKLRRCGKKKLSFVFIFCSQAFIKELFMRSKRTCFCFFKTVTVTQKNHFWKLLYCYIVTQKWSLKSEVWSLREWSLSSYENLSLCSPCVTWTFLGSLKARNLWRNPV